LISLAHHWKLPEQAACLLILALAEDRPGGAARCLSCLRFAAADLNLDLNGQGDALG
jgi:hypothetical protein